MYGVWSCRYCTLLNDDASLFCASCGSENTTSSSNSILRPQRGRLFKWPKISLSGAWNAIDSALNDIRTLPAVFNLSRASSSRDLSSCPPSPTQMQPPMVPCHAISTSSFQLLQNDEKEAASEFDRIVGFCKENNMPFIDDSFPHSKKSIGNFIIDERLNGKKIDANHFIWLRPQDIYTKDGRRYRWSVFLDPKPSDIEQGCLGNCWFLSALAVIAERPDILDQIFLTKTYNPWGVYQIRLCVDGHWQVILVDDFLPCHSQTHGLAFAVGRRNQLWVPLIEKALAKVLGCYAKLPAGRTLEGLAILTGAPCTFLDLENCTDHDLIWAQLLSMREAGFIMGCSCGSGRRYVNEAEFRRVGLQIRHAYSLLDVKEYNNQRVVRLRNPWGSFTWNGPWCDTWSGWDETSRRILLPDGPEAGAFWMPFLDFMQRFDSVEVAKVRSAQGWKEIRVDCSIPQFWGKENVIGFQLQIEEPTELAITVYQKGSRDRCDSDIMVLLHKNNPSNMQIGELIVRSFRRSIAFASTKDVFLNGPALYTVLAISFSNMSDPISIQTVVALHSAKMVMMEAYCFSSSVIAHSMIEMCLKEGQKAPCLDGTVTRYVSKDFGGHILMVENHHHRHFLHVYCDCSQSANVLSTRASLTSVDVIPPMHRQILMLLTHFETTQMYTIHHNLKQRLASSRGLHDWLSLAPSELSLPLSTDHIPLIKDPCVISLHKPRRIG
ncbi:calpain D, putative [Brugia malayi]|uniref:Calpain D, putative n=3 Tax=Brugia TaxID=6278 RepID=A0A4E9FR83_BRUMA|nr:calpain D, putative [Brugia malayi]VIO99042.1 calpain D, putative [Brugia malayi]